MKQELINRLSSCCILTFSLMMTWIDSLIFPNDADGSFKAWLKTQILPNGELRNEAWILLLQNAEFEANSPITSAVAVGWLTERTCPTCDQFKVIINALKISPNFPLYVQSDVLDLVEIEFGLHTLRSLQHNKAFMRNGQQYFVHKPILNIKEWDLIKDSSPYLVVERLVPSHKLNGRKNGWRRDETLHILGNTVHCGWEGIDVEIQEDGELYRPNNIPLTNPIQSIDFYFENYFKVYFDKIKRKGFAGKNNNNINQIYSGSVRYGKKEKVNLRLKIAYKIGNIEKISKPLKYFSIFAETISGEVFISIGK